MWTPIIKGTHSLLH